MIPEVCSVGGESYKLATLNVNIPRFYCFLRKEFLYLISGFQRPPRIEGGSDGRAKKPPPKHFLKKCLASGA